MPLDSGLIIAAAGIGAVLVATGVFVFRRGVRSHPRVHQAPEKPLPLGRLSALHTPPTVPWRHGAGPDRDHTA